jgi:hypothetical protein
MNASELHPHIAHMITYRRCQDLSHLVMTYLLLGKLLLEPLCNFLLAMVMIPLALYR